MVPLELSHHLTIDEQAVERDGIADQDDFPRLPFHLSLGVAGPDESDRSALRRRRALRPAHWRAELRR